MSTKTTSAQARIPLAETVFVISADVASQAARPKMSRPMPTSGGADLRVLSENQTDP